MSHNEKYEKLKNIIDNGRKNLDTVLHDIMHENERREDILVKPSALDYEIDESIHPIITNGGKQRYNLTPFSTRQLYDRAQIPQRYADTLIDLNEKDLLIDNLKKVTEHTAKNGILVRHIDNKIKGWLSPSYKRMDSGPIIEGFCEKAVKLGMVPYEGSNTNYRYQIKFVSPNIISLPGNDPVLFGMSLTTGDYGGQALQLEMMVLRLLCINGMVGYDMFRKIHLGSRIQMDNANIVNLSKQTIELDCKTISSAFGDIMGQFEVHVEEVQKQLQNAVETEIETPETMYQRLKTKGLKKGVIEAVKTVYESKMGVEVLPQEKNLWRFANALSFVSQSQEDEDSRIDLEKTAMELIS